MENYKNENNSVFNVLIIVFAIIIIFVLAFLFYFFAVKVQSVANVGTMAEIDIEKTTASISSVVEEPTQVIYFSVPKEVPQVIKSGDCWTGSIAQPYRRDAFRCMAEDSIYDPCFNTDTKGFVFCQMDPVKNDAFLIELTKDLPVVEISDSKESNWAWFLELEDGTACSPFTGTRPNIDGGIAYYGCRSGTEEERVVLMGELYSGNVWTADKAILKKNDLGVWEINFLEKVEISKVWQ